MTLPLPPASGARRAWAECIGAGWRATKHRAGAAFPAFQEERTNDKQRNGRGA
jgi:hypothetical protein